MEKIVVINDHANTDAACNSARANIDSAQILEYVVADRFLVEAHSFIPIDPRAPQAMDAVIEQQWQSGFLVHSKVGAFAGQTYKCDFDVEITMELMRIAEVVRPDIIVLLSGDKDFIPVILELRRRGIRVEVAAFGEGNAAREVTLKASGFIELQVLLDEELQEQQSQDELVFNPEDEEEMAMDESSVTDENIEVSITQ